MPIVEAAPAKINLALHVRRCRADGYHDIETLFAFCRDGDVVRVATAPEDSFAIEGPFAAGLSADRDNLVVRAGAAFMAAFGIDRHHAIVLEKNLPIASGIGGGSADAAATLRALARLHHIAPEEPRLYAIAADLGADVPACLAGRTAFGTGRGDALRPIAGAPGAPVLLVNPGIAVSTTAVFAGWDGIDRGGIADGPLLIRARASRNDLEPAACLVAPAIAEVRTLLNSSRGVLLARMSARARPALRCSTPRRGAYGQLGRRATAAGGVSKRHWRDSDPCQHGTAVRSPRWRITWHRACTVTTNGSGAYAHRVRR